MIALFAHVMRQETADFAARISAGFGAAQTCAIMGCAVPRSGLRASLCFDQIYPSPDRPACSLGGPVSLETAGLGGKPADIGYHTHKGIALSGISGDSGAVSEKPNKGRTSCRRNPSSLRPLLLSLCQLVWKATPNVPSQARAQAWSRRNCWAPTVPAQCLPVPPQASFVTTSASAAPSAVNFAARNRAVSHHCRRRGQSPAAVLRSWGDH